MHSVGAEAGQRQELAIVGQAQLQVIPADV
jgi:hypothetical protein